MLFFLGQDRSYLSDAPKPEGLLRILCVGDSMTFGQGCLPTETFPFQLETTLNAALWERQVEVINGGVCGYSIHDAWSRYLDKFARFQPDLVVVTVCDNDAELYNHREAIEEHVRRQTYLEFSESCYDPAGEHFPYFRLLLDDMARHTAEGGPPVAVAFYDIHGGNHRALLMPRVRDACCAAGVAFIDLSQDFLGDASATNNRHLKVSDADHHPSPLAHGIAARRLGRSLIAAHLTPHPDGRLTPEEDLTKQCIARAEHSIRSGADPGQTLFFLKRTLAAKRDSRLRLQLPAQALLSEAQYQSLLAALDCTWRRFVNLTVWESYLEAMRTGREQFDFGLRLFDLSRQRLLKCLFVLEKRLANSSLPVVGQFQMPHSHHPAPASLTAASAAPEFGETGALLARVETWREKLTRARDYAARSFCTDSDVADLLPEAAARVAARLQATEQRVRPMWHEAERLITAAVNDLRRFCVLRQQSRRPDGPDFSPALGRAWGFLEEMLGHLDFALTPVRFDDLNLLARSSPTPIATSFTTIQVELTVPRCDQPFTNDEPLSLEVQVRSSGPSGRITSDIHTVVRDGTARCYSLQVPFFVDAELRLGLDDGHEVQLGTVRLANAEDRPITLEATEFTAEKERHAFRTRVLVPL